VLYESSGLPEEIMPFKCTVDKNGVVVAIESMPAIKFVPKKSAQKKAAPKVNKTKPMWSPAIREIANEKGVPFKTIKNVLEESILDVYENRGDVDEETGVILDTDTEAFRVIKNGVDITPEDFDFTRTELDMICQNLIQGVTRCRTRGSPPD
jgi:hypothetical protein